MNKNSHRGERLTAVLFLGALLLCVFLWLYGLFSPSGTHTVQISSLHDAFTNAETIVNDALDSSHSFIQLYGGVQRLLGRRVLNDVQPQNTVYKLSDGTITFVNPTPATNLSDHAEAYLTWQDTLTGLGIPLLHLQAPQKVGKESAPSLPVGVTDYGNQNADQFLSLITAGGASVLDFRETLKEDGEHWTSYFFATDHHWTPEAALLCTQDLVEYLNENYTMGLEPALTASDSFTAQVHEKIFLGSQGKRTGSLYAGVDDLTVLTPNYETSFTYSISSSGTVRTGSFSESLLFLERLQETNLFQTNPYAMYSGGDYAFTRITNHENPGGPKILLLRDSYSCAFTPFLALQCSELITIDPRYFKDDLLSCVEQECPDLVITLYTPGATANNTFFQIFNKP